MNILRHYKSLIDESHTILENNQRVINSYNFHILKLMAYMAVLVFFVLSVLSFLPSVEFYYTFTYQALFAIFFVIFTMLALACYVAHDAIERHPWPLMFVCILLLTGFAMALNLIHTVQTPYTATLCFLVVIPMVVMDSRVRIVLWNALVAVVASLLSYYFKEYEFFVIDLLDCIIFGIVGVVAGNLSRLNYMRYLDLKEHELDRNIEVLKAKNEAKSTFLANMSHEIRTPINAVLGLNEMILRESTERNVLTYANEIKSAGRSLVGIINDVLDFSKIEANKLTLAPTEYHLDSTLNDLVNMVSPRARERGLELRVHVAPETPNVLFGDDVRIKQCVLNLLTNAVKYTNEGYIDFIVDCERTDAKNVLLKIRVRDTGTGIKTENLAKLFSAFERIDEMRYRTTEGTGLGLTITQRLLEKMDSRLHVESEYGKGSEFWFEIEQGIIEDVPIGDFSDRHKAFQSAHETYRELFHAPDARILVIDDMKINLDVIRGLLKRTRIQIDTALSGNEALGLVQRHTYHMIFIDHRMPEMDGIQTLAAIKAMKDSPNLQTPCVALTANAISGAREMYIRKGFVDYIAKPVDHVKLEELLVTYLPKQLMKRASFAEDEGYDEPIERDSFMNEYYKVEGINASAALDFCGDMEVLKGAVRDFYEAIDNQANLIEKYCYQKDVKNYLILVHGLKSSARLIGAEELSKGAAYLEQCAKENKLEEIEAQTPDLLEIFRSFKFKLAQLLVLTEDKAVAAETVEEAEPVEQLAAEEPSAASEKDASSQAKAASTPKQDMDGEQFGGALDALAECIEADDFGAAQNIVQMVEAYNLPLEFGESFEKIKTAIFAADKETALQLLRS